MAVKENKSTNKSKVSKATNLTAIFIAYGKTEQIL